MSKYLDVELAEVTQAAVLRSQPAQPEEHSVEQQPPVEQDAQQEESQAIEQEAQHDEHQEKPTEQHTVAAGDQLECYLRSCSLSDVTPNSQVVALFELGEPPRQYYFARNLIGDRGVEPLVKAIDLDSEFESIIFCGNNLRNEAALWIAWLLERHPHCTTVDLSHNCISQGGARALLKQAQTRKFDVFCIEANPIEAQTQLAFRRAMANPEKD